MYQNRINRRFLYLIQRMKVNFTNKKDHKNCQNFIKAMRELLNFVEKDTQNFIYITAGPRQLKMASSIADFHLTHVPKNCLVVMKSDSFAFQNMSEDNEERIYKINCFTFLKAFKKNEAKITFLQLMCEEQKTTLTFDIEGGSIIFKLKAESQSIVKKWPESPDSEQANYQIIKVGQMGEEQLKSLTLSTEEEQIWTQIWQGGLYMRTAQNGKYRKENKITLKEANDFYYTTLKAKLKKKMFMQLRGEFLMELLYDSLKKKRNVSVSIKNIYSRYNQNQISMSYLITKMEADFGYILGINYCHICQQMGKEGEEMIRKEIIKERERESSLLKRQQTFEDLKRMALNRFNQPGFDRRMAEQAYRDRKPYGKIEQGDQVIERIYRQIQ